MPDDDFIKILFIVACFFLIMGLFSLAGCRTERWAAKKVATVETKQPAYLPGYCAKRFPPKVYDSTRIQYKPGKLIIKSDTTVRVDTVTRIIYKTINNIIRDTVETERVKQVENTAALVAEQAKHDKTKADLQKASADAAKYKKTNSILWWVVIAFVGVWLIRNLLPKLIGLFA